MSMQVIATQDVKRYIENPKLLESEHECKSPFGILYMLTAYESDTEKFDNLLRSKGKTTRKSLLEDEKIEGGFELAFVSPIRGELNRCFGVWRLSEKSLAKKGVKPKELYELDILDNTKTKIKSY